MNDGNGSVVNSRSFSMVGRTILILNQIPRPMRLATITSTDGHVVVTLETTTISFLFNVVVVVVGMISDGINNAEIK